MNARSAACLLLLSLRPADAHRADEYLQATVITLEKGRVQAQIRLTPGTAVFPAIIGGIDTDGDSTISPAEGRAYAEKALSDISLTIDGSRAKLELLSTAFPSFDDMRQGLGEIKIDFAAAVPPRPAHTLVFDNRHQKPIAAYLVNCLEPADPDLQIAAQRRNYGQSHYELEYTQRGVAPAPLAWLDLRVVVGLFAVLLLLRLVLTRRKQPA